MAGRYKQPVQYGRESAHKGRAQENHSSLRDYMYAIQHISKEENKPFSGTREESAVADSAEPKQYGNSSAGLPTFPVAPTLGDA